MAQPTGSVDPSNFPYRTGVFGWFSGIDSYIPANLYTVTQAQESIDDWSNLERYRMRPRRGIEVYCKAGYTLETTWRTDEQKDVSASIAPTSSDDYATHSFNASSPREPVGRPMFSPLYNEIRYPRFYTNTLSAYTDAVSETDADTEVRAILIEHKHDLTPSFTAKMYLCNKGATSRRIYVKYFPFSAYHARRLLRDSYNKILQEARMIMATPCYSATDIDFTTVGE